MWARWPRVAVVLALSMSQVGCSGGGGGIVRAEIGTGTVAFEVLAEGQSVEIIAGPQGGHHFIAHARMSGLLPGEWTMPGNSANPRTTFRAFAEDGDRVSADNLPHRLGYRIADDDRESYELPSGRLLILDPDDPTLPARLYGQRVRLTVEIVDIDGEVATDERWVVATEGPPDGADAGPTADASF